MNPQPLVSIGLPTYNRAASLQRAINSALAQDYPNLELVISDNASTDDTQSICTSYCSRDARVRYLRQPTNRGAGANFLDVFHRSQGDYFMWLADDDWIEPSYISECVAVLQAQSDYSLVGGKAAYFKDGEPAFDGREFNLLQTSAQRRVLAHFKQVGDNAAYYGVMRREQLARVPKQPSIAGDWLVVAALAYLGKIRTLEQVCINRSVGGAAADLESLGLSLGLSSLQAKNPFRTIALTVFKELGWLSPVYKDMAMPARLLMGLLASLTIYYRWSVYDQHSAAHYLNRIRSRLKLRTNIKRVFRSVQVRVSGRSS